ncbi:hypothetical protein DH2020_014649 [Rehmannia glutinosa]|uniref:NB-ARC domain-containing protein n=1 Tax=Rehmannia glutinosa TaxID=99300 RepID=A0ABR0X0J0_REHGL
MAYAAVISLKQTIKRLLNSSHISILPPSRETLEFAYEEVLSLQEVLEKFDTSNSSSSERVNVLDEQIREAVCQLEDLLETNVSNQLLSQSEESCLGGESCTFSFSLNLQELKHDIDSFSYLVYKLKEEYINELSSSLPNEEDDDINISVPSRIYFERNKSKMVGLCDQFCEIRDRIMGKNIVSLLGMAGIGKTTLAKEIFVDPLVLNRFDCRAWVTVGPNYKLERIMKDILAQVNPDINDTMLVEGENKLAQYLSKVLNGRTHLVVFDDVWIPHFIFEFLRIISYDSYDCCRFLITTRLRKVAIRSNTYLQVRLLNKEESWNLLREKVFSQYSCPPQLEKAGKKIAENCDGLPLTIVTVAELLSNADEMTLEYWNKAAEIESSVFNDAYDQISKVLLPSYKCLSQRLKACFLYMGVFPQNSEIPRSKLIKLWSAEGIIEPIKLGTLDDFADKYLKVLVSRSLVMVFEKSSRVKTCGLHSVFWQLCKREAEKIKFFHVLSSYTHSLAKGITCQRRLSILNNTLFAIRDVYNTMTSILTARSLLCYGPPHQYPVQICSDLRLLRVLDALTIRFYEFPMEVLKLVQLRYLALTYNGKLPPSIFKLWNLQFLIVHQHVNIKSSGSQSFLPIEIWDMKELKHLQIMGSNLQDPCGALLPNLLTLLDVSTHNCTKGILKES